MSYIAHVMPSIKIIGSNLKIQNKTKINCFKLIVAMTEFNLIEFTCFISEFRRHNIAYIM